MGDDQSAMQDGGYISLAMLTGEKVGKDQIAFLGIGFEKEGEACDPAEGLLGGFHQGVSLP